MIESTQHPKTRSKVLYLTSSPHLAGAERCLLNIVCHLDSERFQPIVLIPAEGPLAKGLRENGIDVRVYNLGVLENKRELCSPKFLPRFFSMVIAAIRLALLIRSEEVELVHSNTSGVLVGALGATLVGIPHIWHVREILMQPRWLWSIMQWLIPIMSTRVICISTAVKEHFHIWSKLLNKLVIVHDAIDMERFIRDLDQGFILDKNSHHYMPRVGMLARINPWKGHTTFVKAAKAVLRKCPKTQFYIVGGCLPTYQDIKRTLENLVLELGIENQLHLLGDLPISQVAAVVNQIDILVVPSTSPEPFGLTILEGMAFEKPIIASGAGGPRDVVINGATGLLVPPGDPAALAQAIIALLEDDLLRKQMGKAGKQRLIEQFSLKANISAIESIYGCLIEKKTKGRTNVNSCLLGSA
jgi:glycosyltransferase involved in cell wall biosynthesis